MCNESVCVCAIVLVCIYLIAKVTMLMGFPFQFTKGMHAFDRFDCGRRLSRQFVAVGILRKICASCADNFKREGGVGGWGKKAYLNIEKRKKKCFYHESLSTLTRHTFIVIIGHRCTAGRTHIHIAVRTGRTTTFRLNGRYVHVP